jgi:hypothetical protein
MRIAKSSFLWEKTTKCASNGGCGRAAAEWKNFRLEGKSINLGFGEASEPVH